MDGRERLLIAINGQKPDRLPCQVHGWQKYYLDTILGGMDQYEAYKYFNMDPVIYVDPLFEYDDKQMAQWIETTKHINRDADGNDLWKTVITTPEGELFYSSSSNHFTGWLTEYPIKNEQDFRLWDKYRPIPSRVDWTPVINAKQCIGNTGIVRGGFFDFATASPWQSFVSDMFGIEQGIFAAIDDPDWVHHVLRSIMKKKLDIIERAGAFMLDLVETGGGAGSSTVISPEMHKEFCLPYDKIIHKALHESDAKVVYHLCGGVTALLDTVVNNGADGLETMTPSGMGGDCVLAEARNQVGNKLFLCGGFNQIDGFEKGSPALARKMVQNLHMSCPNGGYICSPSDHFFFGDPNNIRAFADECRACSY